MTADGAVNAIYAALGVVFKDRDAAPLIIAPLFLFVALLLIGRGWARVLPWLSATKSRIKTIKVALGRDHDPIAERSAFAENFAKTSQALGAGDSALLRRAWLEYHETIVDETQSPIRNTSRSPGSAYRTIKFRFETARSSGTKESSVSRYACSAGRRRYRY